MTILAWSSTAPTPDAAARELRAKGFNVPDPQIAAYGMRQLWLRDPDGYVLCFQAPA